LAQRISKKAAGVIDNYIINDELRNNSSGLTYLA
jgi:hypothetical protein